MNDYAKSLLKELVRENREMDFLIQTNTELHRKGWGRIWLFEGEKQLYEGNAEITLRQVSHEYKFGASLFMLGCFPEEERNLLFEECFREFFNLGVAPFYWSDLEPEDGKLRFAEGSPEIYRRPPVDRVVEYGRKHNIALKGHPLCWNNWLPDHLPLNRQEWLSRLERRFAEIAERYSKTIRIFDVINEIFSATLSTASLLPNFERPEYQPYAENIVEITFRLAEKHFPIGTQLILNDDNFWWHSHREYSSLYMLARRLLEKGTRLGGVGFQFHLFKKNIPEAKYFMNPVHLYKVLDQYNKLDVPCNFSEVSIISSRDLGDGDTFQKIATEKLYRLWFSHPATDSIVWWNPVDGTAAGGVLGSEDGENYLRAGLFAYDLKPKPAAEVLRHLIHQEWHTEAKVDFQGGGDNRFHGFFGDYEAVIKTDAGTFKKRITLSKHASKDIKIKLNHDETDHFTSYWH